MLKHDRKVHTGVKDYECRVCEAEVTDIQIHMRVSGEVIGRENLRQHLKTKKLSLLTDRVEVMENARHKLFFSSFPLLKKEEKGPPSNQKFHLVLLIFRSIKPKSSLSVRCVP